MSPSLSLSLFHNNRFGWSLLAVHLLVIGSLLFSSVAAATPLLQINAATNLMSPDLLADLAPPPPAQAVGLTLRAAPAQIEPGGMVTITVVIANTLKRRLVS